MMKYMEYLTDAELDSLIREIEQHEMVPSSPDLQEQILAALDQDAKAMEEQKAREKIIDYKKYRFRVMTTVAAAVLVVFLLPSLEGLQQQKTELTRLPKKHEVVMKNRYETKEEALYDSRMLENMLGGVNIFADNNRWNLFKE